jgi:predicted ATPase/DNA-binding CsgD family transcriptional regulator
MASDPALPKLLPVPWQTAGPALETPPAPARAPRHLPTPLTTLVGRDAEVAAACARLTDDAVRLLTFTGPGGVGKTRLAIQAGAAVADAFADGVFFVPLAPLFAPGLVLPTIARTLGVLDNGERSLLDAVTHWLLPRTCLLILDNMEHLLEVGPLLPSLLAACPGLTILVTSRVLLRLSGEHTFPVPPLALPPQTSSARLPSSPAVELFVARAHAVLPEFALTAANAATIGVVCRQLDGLPLAIELAAARLRVLSLEGLLTDLQDRLPLLSDGPRDVPDRLRTMRDAIAWSVERLTDPERVLFCRLGVFVDGFTLEAADWVGGGRTEGERRGNGSDPFPSSVFRPPSSVLDLVTSLVDQSLIQRSERPGDAPRYRMLETIRAFALGELAASGEEAAARASHGAWCLAFAERAEPELRGTEQKVWFDRQEADLPNMRAALAWFLAQGDGEQGLRLASSLTWFWSSRSSFREAWQWLETFLALPTTAEARGSGLLNAANILHWLGDEARAMRHAEDALALFRGQRDDYLAMCALRRLGSIAISQGAFAEAERHLAESQVLVDSPAATWDTQWDVAFAIYLAGRLAAAAGGGEEAVARLTEAATAFREIGDLGYVAAALGRLGAEWINQGEMSRARDAFATSMDLAIELGDQTWVARALVGAAHLAHDAGDPATAARLLGATATMREAIGSRRLPMFALAPALQSLNGQGRHAREWAQGSRMAAAEAVALARAILAGQADPNAAQALTARERDVLHLLAEGLGDKAIGVALGISRRTASQHVAAILGKLEAESRTAAVSRALRDGLLVPADSERA